MMQHLAKAMNDRNTCCFLPPDGRHEANPGAVEKAAAGTPAGDRDRPLHGAIRLAGGYAAVPRARRRIVGGAQQPSKPRIARLLFFVHEGRIGVVHGFIKKTQKTPPEDIALARKRMKEMKE